MTEDRFDRELVKGSTYTLLLSLLSEKPMYGYEIVKVVNGRTDGLFEWREGTLYPALHKLEADGLIQGEWECQPSGRKRKYYHITPEGRTAAGRKRSEWDRFVRGVNAVLGQKHG